MSLLTPVYVAGQLKGIVLLDINKNNLRNIFYTHDRPLLWRFLNVTLTDTDSGRDIIINQSEDNLFQYVSYVHDLPGGIRVSLSIDILYFITSSWKSVLFWILTALILLNMVRMHFRLYQNVSRENISDAMTGLYNRKILTPELGSAKHIASGNKIAVIASAPFFLCPLFDIPYHSPIRVEKQTPPALLDSSFLRLFFYIKFSRKNLTVLLKRRRLFFPTRVKMV